MSADAPLFVGAATEAWPAHVQLRWSLILSWHTECDHCGLEEHAGRGPQMTASPEIIRRARALAMPHRACAPREVR